MPLRALIVDDEPLARERVRTFLTEVPDLELVGECASGTEALSAIVEHTPDIVFLDIQMPGMTGFEVLRALPAEVHPAILFTTAHDQFALEAFEVNAVDYLLKPYKRDRLLQAVERARRSVHAHTAAPANQRLTQWLDQRIPVPPGQRRLLVRNNERVVLVRLDDIDWIEAAGNYAILHTGKTNHVLRETMGHLEEQLPPDLFFRISRSAFVHLHRVRELHAMPGGQYVVLLQDGQKVTMTRPLRDIQERLSAR
ncbi:MAG: response regulator transcription factor [Verrucomicrobiae bacterium]|nr:response regulator transcription factor [Verrucomicrobiae bacterium]